MRKRKSKLFELISPVDGRRLKTIRLLSKEEITKLFKWNYHFTERNTHDETLRFLKRLCSKIKEERENLVPMLVMETGYIRSDSEEIIDASIEFLEKFEKRATTDRPIGMTIPFSFDTDSERSIHLATRPYRRIAAIIPQNASFGMTLIILAAALYTGARVVLRASLQSGLTNEFLSKMVKESNPPEKCVEFVNCLATDFLGASYDSPYVELIHYIGSNQYVTSVLVDSFKSGKLCLLDGQGNGLAYVDRSFPIDDAIKIITGGAVRYNGATCTSINGVLIHPDIYKALRDGLRDSLGALSVGHPLKAGTNVGPLFSGSQAKHIGNLVRSSGGRFISGGKIDGAYIKPGLVEGVDIRSVLVTEGFMGPIVWLAKVNLKDSEHWFNANKYTLSDTILSLDSHQIKTFVAKSKSARVCINVDPSLESMFEPWGGYPRSGLDPVSVWTRKYLQTFQIDGNDRFIKNLNLGLGKAK